MAKKQIRLILISLLVAAALFVLINKEFLPGLSSKSNPYKHYQLLSHVVSLIKGEYVEEPSPLETMEGAFKGLVDSLDIMSSYLDKSNVARYSQRQDQALQETGLILYKSYGTYPVVIGIKENSSAAASELKLGDSLNSINGALALTMSMLEANLYMQGMDDQPVKLEVIRAQKNEILELKKTIITTNAFTYTAAAGTSGILKIHALIPPVVDKIKSELIARLQNQQKPLVLDLRTCHKGTLAEAGRFTNLFIKRDKIGFLQKKAGQKQIFSCPEEALLKELPLIIWTDQATLGPAEMTAGALQRFAKARIIGTQTLGLVARQSLFLLEDGSGVLLTTGIFQLDAKEEFWLKGIKPDVLFSREDITSAKYLEETSKITSQE